ncbi:succinylglutamate desuccinylase/aspartoacylase family protein [Psychroflexus lacisalsi]|jgi:predicted deacylase|uniref:Succinylglutamate desuccinylase/aspartoacylase family protein n=1 Tax=Psychroflexus lacisalsi TaxID=503928 RepID=A0ABN1EY71_9FLAO|nr:succinylglutamate desuccinylase/aspartoacylase family protein [Psychroflexus lacisalsi]MBZ9620797.1 succinylglutamate desuccinylase/aspartoacylase family protein [Psychroflexus lacisalsi]
MPHIDSKNVLHILDRKVFPGEKARINFNTAKLYTTTSVEVPVIIQRAKKPGPVLLITAGIHGDEVNGVETVRQFISKGINKPTRGTVICVPVLNVFGFLNMTREFPDGRDLNRMFPGSKTGALASRFAYQFASEILPAADYCFDFHTGGASRFNAAQIRIDKTDERGEELARVFNAPFTVYSSTIKNSYRMTCVKHGKTVLLFEGGKSKDNNKEISKHGVDGLKRIMKYFDMLKSNFEIEDPEENTKFISSTYWMRAKYSGLLHIKIPIGKLVEKGEFIATITDPYGSFRHKVKASNNGYIINANQSPIVYQGDAIFHISKESTNE